MRRGGSDWASFMYWLGWRDAIVWVLVRGLMLMLMLRCLYKFRDGLVISLSLAASIFTPRSFSPEGLTVPLNHHSRLEPKSAFLESKVFS